MGVVESSMASESEARGESHTHKWSEPYWSGVHCEFPTKTQGVRELFVGYVRCKECGQKGFVKPGSPVIYTWDPNQSEWILP